MALLALAGPARAAEPPKKRHVQGAPIFVDEYGNRVPGPSATAPNPAPAPAPAPAYRAPSGFGSENDYTRAWGWGLFLIALIAWKWFRRPHKVDFNFEPVEYRPGEVAKGTFLSDARPDSISAVCELYGPDSDLPQRTLPVTIGQPVQDHDAWRVPMAVALPPDARPDFDGGWALSVTAEFGRARERAGDNVLLKDFMLESSGPFAPGAVVRGILYTLDEPKLLTVALGRYPDETSEDEDALEKVEGKIVSSVKSPGGEWRVVVEAALPATARRVEGSAWLLHAEDEAVGLDEWEEVPLQTC